MCPRVVVACRGRRAEWTWCRGSDSIVGAPETRVRFGDCRVNAVREMIFAISFQGKGAMILNVLEYFLFFRRSKRRVRTSRDRKYRVPGLFRFWGFTAIWTFFGPSPVNREMIHDRFWPHSMWFKFLSYHIFVLSYDIGILHLFRSVIVKFRDTSSSCRMIFNPKLSSTLDFITRE